jgi:hypothetical protein
MGKKQTTAIDSLFGSKTRVKLLHLFYNNPGKAFYVREITRLIDEQINSVRRELSNMLEVGVIISSSSENKLYYEVDQRYEHFVAFRDIFIDANRNRKPVKLSSEFDDKSSDLQQAQYKNITQLSGLRVAIIAGALVKGSASPVDLLIAGAKSKKLLGIIKDIESIEGRELTYSILSYDEFYYRLSVRDKFVNEMLSSKHNILLDTESIFSESNKEN